MVLAKDMVQGVPRVVDRVVTLQNSARVTGPVPVLLIRLMGQALPYDLWLARTRTRIKARI